MEETISFKDLFLIVRKRLTMIIGITFIVTLISAIVSFYFITPVYQSSTQILVNQKREQGVVNAGDVQTNLQLVNTYNVIIKSPAILEKVKDQLKLDMSVQQLTNKVTVAAEKQSQVISITVEDTKPDLARDIANTTAAVFQAEVTKIMNIDNVTILSKADVVKGQSPVKPRPIINIAIAFVVGLILSGGLAFLLDYLDNTIKGEQDIETILGLPVLGVITQMEEKKTISAVVTKVREQTIGS